MNLPPLPTLPALPVLPTPQTQVPLPFEPIYSPWYPIDRAPWEAGYYDAKLEDGRIIEARQLFNGSAWPGIPDGVIAWRGLAHPPV